MRRGVGLLIALLLVASCRTTVPESAGAAARLSFLVESDGPGARTVVLPQSRVSISVAPQSVLTATDIVRTAVGTGEFGEGLVVELSNTGGATLGRLATTAAGRRLVVLLGDTPLGVFRLTGPVRDTRLYLLLEVPASELPNIVRRVNRGLRAKRVSAGDHALRHAVFALAFTPGNALV